MNKIDIVPDFKILKYIFVISQFKHKLVHPIAGDETFLSKIGLNSSLYDIFLDADLKFKLFRWGSKCLLRLNQYLWESSVFQNKDHTHKDPHVSASTTHIYFRLDSVFFVKPTLLFFTAKEKQ